MSELLERLESALPKLEHQITDFHIRAEHMIPDLVTLGFARDTFENANAALLIGHSGIPRAVGPCGRAAFEAAVEMMFLLTRENYDYWGSRARATELLDIERQQAMKEILEHEPDEGSNEEHLLAAVDVMESDAKVWEGFSEGKGDILRAAIEDVRGDRENRRWHWTGMSRSQILDELPEDVDEESVRMMRSWYGLLSMESHPAPRLTPKHLDIDSSGTFTIKVTPANPDELARLTDVAVGAAFVAVEAARDLLGQLSQQMNEERYER